MKTKLTYLLGAYALGILLTAGIYSCKGELGPAGPQGTAGTTGQNGASGPQGASGVTGPAGTSGAQGLPGTPGKDGNANVVYTDWKSMPTDVYIRGISNQSVIFQTAITSQTVLTRDALDKAAIFVYYKVFQPVFDNSTATFKLQERIGQGSGNASYTLIPGRNPADFASFLVMSVNNGLMGINFFAPNTSLQTRETNAAGVVVAIPEYVVRDAAYFRDLIKDAPQYRIMVVYGSTKGGRTSYNGRPVDFNDYAQVKSYFNLAD